MRIAVLFVLRLFKATEGAILVGFLDSENCRPSCNTLILRLLRKSMQFSPIHDRTILIPAGPIGEEPAVEEPDTKHISMERGEHAYDNGIYREQR